MQYVYRRLFRISSTSSDFSGFHSVRICSTDIDSEFVLQIFNQNLFCRIGICAVGCDMCCKADVSGFHSVRMCSIDIQRDVVLTICATELSFHNLCYRADFQEFVQWRQAGPWWSPLPGPCCSVLQCVAECVAVSVCPWWSPLPGLCVRERQRESERERERERERKRESVCV